MAALGSSLSMDLLMVSHLNSEPDSSKHHQSSHTEVICLRSAGEIFPAGTKDRSLLVHVFDSRQDHDAVGESTLDQEVKRVPEPQRKPRHSANRV